MKRIFNISYWVILLGSILTLAGFIAKEKNTLRCMGLEINIDRTDNNYFVLEEDIRELFLDMGYEVNQLITNLDTRKIEQRINNNPSVQKADVYITVDGKLKINIKQRLPILRVYNAKGESFYIDEEGWLMPLSDKFTTMVLVANGNIKETYSARYKNKVVENNEITNKGTESEQDSTDKSGADILRDLFILTKYINKNEFWRAQITQLFVNDDKEIELIPRVGNHNILFGDISDMEEKFEKLMTFYKKGLKKVGWNSYKQINLKFKNQVVCTKNKQSVN